MTLKLKLILAAAVVLTPVVALAVASILSRRAPTLGLPGGHLTPCPDTPNCVCSNDTDPGHAIEPLKFKGSAEAAWQRLHQVIRELPRVEIVTDRPDYLHATATTAFFRFIDDIEFHLDQTAGVIHVRSASRVGRSDFAVNRKRVEAIRMKFGE